MGCRIIVGKDDDGKGVECACFYDSVTETVFGVKMNDLEEAEAFREWCECDLRIFKGNEFDNVLSAFRASRSRE